MFATCGKYRIALAFAATLADIGCKIYIPVTYHTRREVEMKTWGAEIIKMGNDYEEAVFYPVKLPMKYMMS